MMSNSDATFANPLLIAGAGPAGLLLGHYLYQYELPFHIVEKAPAHHRHSRAIGIHPVSLGLFEELGLLDRFLREGVRIRRGSAFLNRTFVGGIDFSVLHSKYPFILSIPQYKTEEILRDTLLTRQPDSISYSTELRSLQIYKQGITARLQKDRETGASHSYSLQTPFLVGCDGRDSTVRNESGLSWNGYSYPDTYIMGDFQQQDSLPYPAVIYLHKQGVIESFALPDNGRRWVVKLKKPIKNNVKKQLTQLVYRRIGIDLNPENCLRYSTFGAERYLSSSFFNRRCILAGDAAHVVNPIGGQGMNLGWMGVRLLAHCLHQIHREHKSLSVLTKYEKIQKKRARKVMRRAAFNMKLGRSYTREFPRRMLLHLMLNTPLHHITARMFTMQNLDHWPV